VPIAIGRHGTIACFGCAFWAAYLFLRKPDGFNSTLALKELLADRVRAFCDTSTDGLEDGLKLQQAAALVPALDATAYATRAGGFGDYMRKDNGLHSKSGDLCGGGVW
jgi:hypothetical protein